MRVDPKTMIEALRRVIKRLHYPVEVMLVCVRWYVAYPLSLRHLEEMMVERAVVVALEPIFGDTCESRNHTSSTRTLLFARDTHGIILSPVCFSSSVK